MNAAGYANWIERERRVRVKILQSSPVIREERNYRQCADCEEICLCHEEICPNCNSSNILVRKLEAEVNSGFIKERIRCRYRFSHLSDEPAKEK